MKLNSLSVKKLLRAITAPVMLASTLLSGSLATAGTVYVADGINLEDYNKSERFYHSVKGPYANWRALQTRYEETGNLDFLGNLAQYVKPNAAGKIDLTDYDCRREFSEDTMMCWAHAAADAITYWQTYYGVFYKGDKELPYGLNYDRSLLDDTNNSEFTQVITDFVINWSDDGGNAIYAYEWYFNGGLPLGYPVGDTSLLTEEDAPALKGNPTLKGWSVLENKDSGGYGAGYGVQMEWHSTEWIRGHMTRGDILNMVADAFGYTKNGTDWLLTEENRICSVGVGGDIAHALTCLGFGTDDNGELEYLIFIDNDGLSSEGVTKVYLKKDQYYIDEESWLLYYDKACTRPYAGCSVILETLEWIDTPDALKAKYEAYNSADSVLVWTGKREDGKWADGEYTLEKLPTDKSGWKIYAVDDYYNAYYRPERDVLFDDTAEAVDVTVAGALKAGDWVVDNTAKTYSFTGGAGASLTVDSFTKSGTEKVSLKGLSVTSAGACTVSAGTLEVGNCELAFDSASVAADATFSVTASTKLTVTNALTMASGSTLNFTLGAVDDAALLTFNGTLTPESTISVTVDDTTAVIGSVYHLMSFTGNTISGAELFTCSQGVLSYADNMLSLLYYTGGYMVWEIGDGEWSSTRWESEDVLTTNLAGVLFTGEGEGTTANITVVGDVKPAEMKADNAGTIVLGGSGRIVGTSSLTMQGSGELKLEMANAYTGGTVVESGTVTAGHADALGTGKVSLKGGTLNLCGTELSNAIEVQGKSVLNGAEAYLGGLSLMSGELSGGLLNLRQKLELREGSIANDLQGTGSIVKLGAGKAVLSGKNTGTGTVTITEGTLEVASPDSLGVGNVELNGGILSTPAGVTLSGQSLNLNGGDVSGSLTLGEYATLDVQESATVNGSLTLQSGTVKLHNKLLTVTESLVIDGNTRLDVSCWLEYGTYRMMRVGSVSGNLDDLELYTTGRNSNRVSKSGSFILLTVSAAPTTLYWTAEDGVWANRGDVEWTGTPGETLADARFHAKDDVVFAQGGNVTIEGEVAPESIVVSGEDALVLMGDGSIVGKTSVRKDGSGSLQMNAVNTYIGETTINDGLVTAGGDASFGSGTIILNGGVLDLQGYAVKNDIQAYGGALAASAYEGNLVVSGDLQISPELRAKGIRLISGSISGKGNARARAAVRPASIIDTPIDAYKGCIDVDMLGTTSLKVSRGAVEVSGVNNSYTGGTVVEGGSLTVAEGSSLGAGPISLMGGILKAAGGISLVDGQNMSMQGGRFEGGLRTTSGSIVSAISGSTVEGSLTLGGGWVKIDYQMGAVHTPGIAVAGNLSVTETTAITLSGNYTQDSVVFSFDSMSGSVENLVLVDAAGRVSEELQLRREENNIVLSLAETVRPDEEPSWKYDAAELNDMLAQTTWGAFHASHAFTDAIRGEKFSGAPVGQGVSFWVSGIQSFATVDSSGLNKGGDASHTGGAIGLEMLVGDRSCIGMAAGMLYGEIQTDGNQTEMDQDSVHLAVYGATRLYGNEKSALTLSAYAAYGTYESTSTAQYASDMTWEQDAIQLNARLDWATAVSDTLSVNVFGGLEYFAASDDEVNGISSGELTNVRAELGAGVTKLVGRAGFHAEARFLGDIVRDDPTPTVNGVKGDAANPGRVGLGLSAGAVYNITPSWSVNANANAEFMDGASSCNMNVGTVIRF